MSCATANVFPAQFDLAFTFVIAFETITGGRMYVPKPTLGAADSERHEV